MTDPVFGLIAAALLFTLLVAMIVPAPSHPVEDDAGVGLGLIVGGCVAALAMGVLALAGLTIASAVLGAVAWVLVMPCVWMARAPQPSGGSYDGEEDDDDGGGSPSPDAPAAPPVPSDTLPGLQPTATQPAPVTWTPAPAPQAAPVLGLAARVQQMLAAEESQRLRAAQDVQRSLASAPPVALPPPVVVPAVAPVVEPVLAPATVPEPVTDEPRTRPAPRVRDTHHSVGHVLAAAAHTRTRRRAGAKDKRRDESRRD